MIEQARNISLSPINCEAAFSPSRGAVRLSKQPSLSAAQHQCHRYHYDYLVGDEGGVLEGVDDGQEAVETEGEEGEERDGLQDVERHPVEGAHGVTRSAVLCLDGEEEIKGHHEETCQEIGHGERDEEVGVDARVHRGPRHQQHETVGDHDEDQGDGDHDATERPEDVAVAHRYLHPRGFGWG